MLSSSVKKPIIASAPSPPYLMMLMLRLILFVFDSDGDVGPILSTLLEMVVRIVIVMRMIMLDARG